jgi:hypothetical protein
MVFAWENPISKPLQVFFPLENQAGKNLEWFSHGENPIPKRFQVFSADFEAVSGLLNAGTEERSTEQRDH